MNNFIPSPKKLSIFVNNPEDEVAIDAGECSKEKEVVDNLIKRGSTFIQFAQVSHKNILKGGRPNQLDIWIENVQSSGRKRMDSFCEDLKKDILAIKNAIIYNWINGLVEGNVDKLKNKKREMYGRCGFELLRRKVCLSQTG